MQYLVRKISNKLRNNLCFLATIGIWGMVAYKTGGIQKSIDADLKTLAQAKSTDEETKKKADYLHRVKTFEIEKLNLIEIYF